jgi:hypothetical protein
MILKLSNLQQKPLWKLKNKPYAEEGGGGEREGERECVYVCVYVCVCVCVSYQTWREMKK